MRRIMLLERIPQVAFSNDAGSSFSNPKKVGIDPDVKNSWDWIWGDEGDQTEILA